MANLRSLLVTGSLVALIASGCTPVTDSPGGDGVEPAAGGDRELAAMLLSRPEAAARGDWVVTPDDGPVDSGSADCTGEPYDWPALETLAHASQFLDHEQESVALLIKRLDGDAAANVDALRGALAPCAPASGDHADHGAMIDPVGDDSFAYQTQGKDALGEFVFSNVVVACGTLHFEALVYSYSGALDQRGVEDLIAPVIDRMIDDQDC